MMKAWKGQASDTGCVQADALEEHMKYSGYHTPVLVIDASDFPADYPEIGSEWLWCGDVVKVEGHPIHDDDLKQWEVTVRVPSGQTLPAPINTLKPIPQTATGEVVGSVNISGSGEFVGTLNHGNGPVEPGTYDIIRREP